MQRFPMTLDAGTRRLTLLVLGICALVLGMQVMVCRPPVAWIPLLTAALGKINPAHSDAVIGRAHLQALEAGQSCGCDNQPEALAEAFREFVLSRLPADLLERFEVRIEEGDFKMDVHLKREPEEEELDHLNRVINHALTEFRQKVRERR